VPTDDRGAFVAPGLAAGTYSVRVVAVRERVYLATAEMETGSEAEFVLSPIPERTRDRDADGTVRVLGPDGEPVPRARVSVWRGGEEERCLYEQGEATFRGMPGVKGFRVEVSRARSRSGLRDAFAAVLAGPFPEGTREVTVRLSPSRTIAGRVADEDGAAVSGVHVRAMPARPFDVVRGGEEPHAEAFTREDGSFELRGTGDLEYRIEVPAPPGYLDPEPVPARGGDTGLELVLARGRTARIVVVDPRGEVVPEASISVFRSRPGSYGLMPDARLWRTTDREGRATLAGLLDREAILKVSPPRDRPDLLKLERRPWTVRDETLTLEEGLVVTGSVRTAGGAIPEGAFVWTGEFSDSVHPVATDGTFRIGPLEAGPVGLVALPKGTRTHRILPPMKTVPAGARDVRLVLAEPWDLAVVIPALEPRDRFRLRARLTKGSGFDEEIILATRSPRGPRWSGDRLLFETLFGEGPFRLELLEPDSGRRAVVEDIRASRPEIEVELAPGRTIRGRLLLPDPAPLVRISADGADWSVPGQVEEDGSFTIPGVPPGEDCSVVIVLLATDPRPHVLGRHEATPRGDEPLIIDLRR
jgi:hypothetical protein